MWVTKKLDIPERNSFVLSPLPKRRSPSHEKAKPTSISTANVEVFFAITAEATAIIINIVDSVIFSLSDFVAFFGNAAPV